MGSFYFREKLCLQSVAVMKDIIVLILVILTGLMNIGFVLWMWNRWEKNNK